MLRRVGAHRLLAARGTGSYAVSIPDKGGGIENKKQQLRGLLATLRLNGQQLLIEGIVSKSYHGKAT